MERFSLGRIDGLEELKTVRDLQKLEEEDQLFVYLDRESNDRLTFFYSMTKRALQKGVRVFVIKVKDESTIALPICALVVSYGGTDIYTLEESSLLTFNYIKSIEERKPTVKEIDWYVDASITAYDDISSLLTIMRDTVRAEDTERLSNIIRDYAPRITNFVGTIEYMRAMTDKALDEQNNFDNIQKDLDEMTSNVKNLEEAKSKLEKERISLLEKLGALERKSNSREPVISEYTELRLKDVKNVDVQRILYFKEISPCKYISSLLYSFIYFLTRIRKLKVKFLIYDYKNDVLGKYAPIELVDSRSFLQNKDRLIHDVQEMVIIEPNTAIIESILKADFDVLLIYDRLGLKKDILTDVVITKFYVVNSRKEFDGVGRDFQKDLTIDRVISNEGVFPEAISIRNIDGYKSLNDSSKLSKYQTMQNASSTRSGKVIDLICDAAHIYQLQPRK